MKFRKSWKRFWTLDRHHSDGFTLVELIVVIAIMAILAGVGTVGYSGYITNANKNADKVLVGNIIRAIETGTNSTMFVNDDSFVRGTISYPVGIIVLTQNPDGGCQVMTSGTGTHIESTTCDIVNANGAQEQRFVNTFTYKKESGTLSSVDVYTNITYSYPEFCSVHTSLPDKREGYPSAYKDNCTGYVTGSGTKIEEYFLEDCRGLFELKDRSNGHFDGDEISVEELNKINQEGAARVSATESGALYDAIKAAFGDPSALKLVYEGWGVEEGSEHTYATLASYADEMIGNIKGTVGTLVSASNIPVLGSVVKGFLSKDYADSADMMNSFAKHAVTRYNNDPQKMVDAWNDAKDAGLDYTFGMNDAAGYHHDYVYAATKAYNAAFASYCNLHATEATKPYISAIENFATLDNEGKLSTIDNAGIDMEMIPRTVNTAAFNKTPMQGKTLLDQFKNTLSEDTDAQAEAAFGECAELYKKYIASDVYEKNALTLYNTLDTLVKTGTDAYQSNASTDPEKQKAEDHYFAYYENYFKEMSAFYQEVEDQQGKGIIIVVTVENGLVKCDVSPSDANPRND